MFCFFKAQGQSFSFSHQPASVVLCLMSVLTLSILQSASAPRFLKQRSLEVTVVHIQADQDGNEAPTICSYTLSVWHHGWSSSFPPVHSNYLGLAPSVSVSLSACVTVSVILLGWNKTKHNKTRQHKAAVSLCCDGDAEVKMSDQPESLFYKCSCLLQPAGCLLTASLSFSPRRDRPFHFQLWPCLHRRGQGDFNRVLIDTAVQHAVTERRRVNSAKQSQANDQMDQRI